VHDKRQRLSPLMRQTLSVRSRTLARCSRSTLHSDCSHGGKRTTALREKTMVGTRSKITLRRGCPSGRRPGLRRVGCLGTGPENRLHHQVFPPRSLHRCRRRAALAASLAQHGDDDADWHVRHVKGADWLGDQEAIEYTSARPARSINSSTGVFAVPRREEGRQDYHGRSAAMTTAYGRGTAQRTCRGRRQQTARHAAPPCTAKVS